MFYVFSDANNDQDCQKITEIQGRKKISSNELELNCFWRGGDCSPEGKFIREESMLSGHWPANPDYRITMPQQASCPPAPKIQSRPKTDFPFVANSPECWSACTAIFN